MGINPILLPSLLSLSERDRISCTEKTVCIELESFFPTKIESVLESVEEIVPGINFGNDAKFSLGFLAGLSDAQPYQRNLSREGTQPVEIPLEDLSQLFA